MQIAYFFYWAPLQPCLRKYLNSDLAMVNLERPLVTELLVEVVPPQLVVKLCMTVTKFSSGNSLRPNARHGSGYSAKA